MPVDPAYKKALIVASRHAECILFAAATGKGTPDDYLMALGAIRRLLPDYASVERATERDMGAVMCLYQDAGVVLGIALGLRMRR